MPTAKEFLDLLLTQDGDVYIFGAEVSPSNSNPKAFDCSELVEWGCARLGVSPTMPDGALNQVRHCRRHNSLIPVDQAISTVGALLFYFAEDPFRHAEFKGRHVAVSQGNGKTFEAKGKKYGVGAFSAKGRGWTHAGLVPGLDYGPVGTFSAPAEEEVEEVAGLNYRVTAEDRLNIRSGPGVEYEVEGELAHGEVVIVPETEGWLPILLEDDTIGWVSQKYLEAVPTEVPSGPAPAPAPPGPTAPGGGLTTAQLRQIVPSLSGKQADALVTILNQAMQEGEINSPRCRAAFIAQLAHESQGFSRFTENLNYGAAGLLDVFGKYFTEEEAREFARQPEKIANRVYADRLGNGDEDSGDGWRYRGRGFIQLTGKDNYREAGRFLNLDLVNQPELAEGLETGARIAAWYWTSRQLNHYADRGQFDTITKKINGGFNGLEDRRAYYQKAKEVLEA